MSDAELAHAAEQRVVVLGDETEPFVVAVEQHALAGLGVDRDLVGHAGGVEPRDHTIAVRVAKRGSSNDSSWRRFSARAARVAKRGSVASSGRPSAPHSASQCASSTAAIWIQPSCVSYKRYSASVPVCALSSRGRGHGLAVDEQRVGREHRAAVEQRRPELLALAAHALVVQRGEATDDRQHRVRGVGHPEAQVVRRVAFAHRTLLVLEPGRRLVERVEAAEVRERTFEAVRPRVAVDDVGLHALAVLVPDAEPHRDARRHVVVHDVGALDELQRDLVPALAS